MKTYLSAMLCAAFLLLVVPSSHAQMIANKKLSASDLGAAQAETKSAGGNEAQLIYATRLDAVEKGAFDSLVVIYGKGKDTFAMVVRGGKRFMLKTDASGQAVKPGEQFQRMGVKYEAGKAPLLRLFAVGTGGALRNADYRFNGTEFVSEG